MNRITVFLSRLINASEWRDIATAPFDRKIELATLDSETGVPGPSCIRHADQWLDAATLKPVNVSATHWRFPRPAILPISCC